MSICGRVIVAPIAVSADFSRIQDEKTESLVAKSIVGRGKAQGRGDSGSERFLYLKVVIAKGVMEFGLQPVSDWLELGKTIEVSVNEISEVEGEFQFVPVEFIYSILKFFSALAVEPSAGRGHVGILAVSNESEGEKGFVVSCITARSHRSSGHG